MPIRSMQAPPRGLWKSTDGGRVFKLVSPPNLILNGVLVDPRNSRRLLIATDRGGIFASDDAGADLPCLERGLQPAPGYVAAGQRLRGGRCERRSRRGLQTQVRKT